MNDKQGKSAGNIDVVLVQYDEAGRVLDFGSLEVQAVYISGNLRKSFYQPFKENREGFLNVDWSTSPLKPPRPDYLSSSRKRLAPQLIYKGGIFHAWRKRQAVAVHLPFFEQMPPLPVVPQAQADMAWIIYDFAGDSAEPRTLQRVKTVYTAFKASLDAITVSEPGNVSNFVSVLQGKLSAQQSGVGVVETTDSGLIATDDETELAESLANF